MTKSYDKMKPVARRDGMVIQKLPEELLVYDNKTHKAHCLNIAAALLWEHCDGQRSVSDICALLQQSEEEVWKALDQLSAADLLEQPFPSPDKSMTINRRQLMKAAGAAALIAAPLVSSIVVPTAAQASTCTASGGTCSISAQCCSGLCSGGACA